ncbi:hypothetical protein [Nitrosovibrio sp. Nv6]|uniref:hypothetical protein n=1 Tax=Nitrosovibrio sp. Nv6 TaxID=1855340 RepID=UPI0008CFC2CB|nr:hypothetical protein [Nitrosovibrio sp. Nv6]SEP38414.1 hypothetical protein SAMN05216316_2707 [Nitrosovibrio sp. Nv6]
MENEDGRLSLDLDLTYLGYRGETLPFRISLRADALPQLIDAAAHGDRIYELFSICRHGDIKRYLWVRAIEAAERIACRYQWISEEAGWPKKECHYPKWDNAFYLTWDEQPEECAWHWGKRRPEIKEFVDYWFDRVLAAKELLRQSGDIFTQREISLIDSSKHDYEYETERPFVLTPPGTRYIPVKDQYPEWFYEYLAQILGQCEIGSVSYRSTDLRTFRLMCAEQLKRCVDTNQDPKTVFPVSVMNLRMSNKDYFPRASRWGGYALYSEEGLGYGDLLIDMDRQVGCPPKVLYEQYYRCFSDQWPLYILTDEEMGEIRGYKRKVLREAYLFLYKKLLR